MTERDRLEITLSTLVRACVLRGSRGAARRRGLVDPPEADYDYCIFTDDKVRVAEIVSVMREIVMGLDFKLIDRPNGYATISGRDMDISVHPMQKKYELDLYDELRHRGVGKQLGASVLHTMQAVRLGLA